MGIALVGSHAPKYLSSPTMANCWFLCSCGARTISFRAFGMGRCAPLDILMPLKLMQSVNAELYRYESSGMSIHLS